MEAFVSARLLVTDYDAAQEATVGLAHEALIRAWRPLHGWIEEEMGVLRIRGRLAEQAMWWQAENQNPDLLLRDRTSLLEAEMFSIIRAQELDEAAKNFVLSSIRAEKQRGRRFLLVVLATAVAIILFAVASWLSSGIENIWRAELGPAACLSMLIAPVAIRFWRKCRAPYGLLLLRRELWLQAIGLTASATVWAGSFWLMQQHKAKYLDLVQFAGFYAILFLPAAVSFVGRLLACWRWGSRRHILTHRTGWNGFTRQLRVADMAETIAVFMTAFYCMTGLLAVAQRLLGVFK